MPVIKAPVYVHDARTGELLETQQAEWHFAAPDTSDGRCGECAVKHDPDQPHNAQSLAYNYMFYAKHGRWPTWADAVAHCSAEVQAAWKKALQELGGWTEPEAAEVIDDK